MKRVWGVRGYWQFWRLQLKSTYGCGGLSGNLWVCDFIYVPTVHKFDWPIFFQKKKGNNHTHFLGFAQGLWSEQHWYRPSISIARILELMPVCPPKLLLQILILGLQASFQLCLLVAPLSVGLVVLNFKEPILVCQGKSLVLRVILHVGV